MEKIADSRCRPASQIAASPILEYPSAHHAEGNRRNPGESASKATCPHRRSGASGTRSRGATASPRRHLAGDRPARPDPWARNHRATPPLLRPMQLPKSADRTGVDQRFLKKSGGPISGSKTPRSTAHSRSDRCPREWGGGPSWPSISRDPRSTNPPADELGTDP